MAFDFRIIIEILINESGSVFGTAFFNTKKETQMRFLGVNYSLIFPRSNWIGFQINS